MGSEWIETTLGELAPFAYGRGLPEHKRDHTGNVPVYGSNGIVGYHNKSLTSSPTIIIGRKGTVGAIHFSPKACWPIDTTFYIEDENLETLRFKYYLLKTRGLEHMNADSAVPGLNREAAHARKILIPPLPEQRAIAHILGTLDDKIELNRRMNQTLEEMARALFKSWFVDFDPVRAKAAVRREHPDWSNAQVSRAACPNLKPEIAELFPDEFENSELGEIPKGWRVGTIADCCLQILNGGTPSRKEPNFWKGGTIPWLNSAEVRQPIITNTENYITEAGLEASSAKWVPLLSTVVALYGATAGQVSLLSLRLTTNQAVCALVPKRHFEFFNYLWMRSSIPDLENKAVGSAQQNISQRIVAESRVLIPSEAILEIFNEKVRPIFDRWIYNISQSRTLAALRDTLLPKLISGELRVKDAEKFLKERGI